VRALVLSGGVGHDFDLTSSLLAGVLGEAGFETDVVDLADGFARLRHARPDLFVVNALRWRMLVERFAPQRERWAYESDPEDRQLVEEFVAGGGGLLGIHTAPICFDDWDGWRDLLGARWDWDTSHHPPYGPAKVNVRTDAHPLVAGITDFEVEDEIYGFMDVAGDVDGLAFAPHGGRDHPLLWAREVGRGRVVYDALGHDGRVYESPEHRRILRRAALWATGRPNPEVESA
jgi:type 1 glutamine amidotransferase